MRKIKKMLALTMCAVMMMSSSVYAADYKMFFWDEFEPGDSWYAEDAKGNEVKYTIPDSFSSEWERKVQWIFKQDSETETNACWVTVGFDTWCFNEDYIKDVHGNATYKVCGAVRNSKGKWSPDTSWGSSLKKSNKQDIRHTGDDVTYWVALGK